MPKTLKLTMPATDLSQSALRLGDLALILRTIHQLAGATGTVSPFQLATTVNQTRGAPIAADDLRTVLRLWGWTRTEFFDPIAKLADLDPASLPEGFDAAESDPSLIQDLRLLWTLIPPSPAHTMKPSERRMLITTEQERIGFMSRLFVKEVLCKPATYVQDFGDVLDSLSRGLACAIRDEVSGRAASGSRGRLQMTAETFSTNICKSE